MDKLLVVVSVAVLTAVAPVAVAVALGVAGMGVVGYVLAGTLLDEEE